jgi:hypothetical protein
MFFFQNTKIVYVTDDSRLITMYPIYNVVLVPTPSNHVISDLYSILLMALSGMSIQTFLQGTDESL